MTYAIGYICGDRVHSGFCAALTDIMAFEWNQGRLFGIIQRQSSPYTLPSRNALAAEFMGSSAEWLLMLDSDMDPPPDIFDKLLAHADGKTMVGALYFGLGADGSIKPVMFGADNKPIMEWTKGELVESQSTGGGCLLIHRYIFEMMEKPWWRADPDGIVDFDQNFCKRAIAAGTRLVIDTSIVVPHCKQMMVDERHWLDAKREAGIA